MSLSLLFHAHFVVSLTQSHSIARSHKRDQISAHWCPPCRGFTPVLAKAYSARPNQNVEVVFASSDQDAASFESYYGSMPWLALPYDERGVKDKLSELYGVRGIPTLVVLDKNGSVVTKNGRSEYEKYFGGSGGGAGCVIL